MIFVLNRTKKGLFKVLLQLNKKITVVITRIFAWFTLNVIKYVYVLRTISSF